MSPSCATPTRQALQVYGRVTSHSGLRVGRNRLIDYLGGLQQLGVNHVAFNLKASRRPATEVLQELAEFVLPAFPSN